MGTNQAGKGLFVIYVEIWSWRALACWVGTGLNSREGKGSREEAGRRCSQKKTAGEKGTAGHKGKRNRWCAGALALLVGRRGAQLFISNLALRSSRLESGSERCPSAQTSSFEFMLPPRPRGREMNNSCGGDLKSLG
jgi:hypothetical protein